MDERLLKAEVEGLLKGLEKNRDMAHEFIMKDVNREYWQGQYDAICHIILVVVAMNGCHYNKVMGQ